MVTFDLESELHKSAYQFSDTKALVQWAGKVSASMTGVLNRSEISPHDRLQICMKSLQARFTAVENAPADILFLVNLRSLEDYRRLLPWLDLNDEVWLNAAERLGYLRICPVEIGAHQVGQIVAFTWTMDMILNNLRNAKREALSQLIRAIDSSKEKPSIIGLGAAMPSLIERELYHHLKDRDITYVSGHHSTVLASIEIMKLAVEEPPRIIAILGVGKIGRSAALAIAEEFSGKGLRELYLIDPNFGVPEHFIDRILATGVNVKKLTHYRELKDADVVMGYPSATDFPLDHYFNTGGRLKRGAVVINDAQPSCISWQAATQLWNKGAKVYSVSTSHPDVRTNICFEPNIGGYDNHQFYSCLAEVLAVRKQREKGNIVESLMGHVEPERLPEIKQWHQEAGIEYPLTPFGDTTLANSDASHQPFIELCSAANLDDEQAIERLLM